MRKQILFAVLALGLAACTPVINVTAPPPQATSGGQLQSASPQSSASAQSKIVVLSEQNNSGQNGMALLSATQSGKTKVQLVLSGGNFTNPQPAHIHEGSCPNPGAIKYPLSDVIRGQSTTELNIRIEDLLSGDGNLAINVHKSASEQNVYTACGNIK